MKPQISYLGTVLGEKCGTSHCESRIRGATRAFYGLQGAGIKFPGVAPHIMIDIYNTAIRSILTYGCTTTYLTKTNLMKLDRYQGKILKQCLGLNNRSRTTPLLKAMCVDPISVSVSATSMELLKACVLRNSLCQDRVIPHRRYPYRCYGNRRWQNDASQIVVSRNGCYTY